MSSLTLDTALSTSCPASRPINKNRTGLVDDLINVDMKKLIVQNVIIINDNFSIIRYYLVRKFIVNLHRQNYVL